MNKQGGTTIIYGKDIIFDYDMKHRIVKCENVMWIYF